MMKEGNQQNEAQSERKIKCKTYEGEIVEVPCQLMIQSTIFKNIWEDLKWTEEENHKFTFELIGITGICFGKIVEWMEQHKGQPEPVFKTNPNTSERIWHNLTPWERKFFDVDFETLKEYFVAASFLKLESLFIEVSGEDLALTREVLENCHLIDWPAAENQEMVRKLSEGTVEEIMHEMVEKVVIREIVEEMVEKVAKKANLKVQNLSIHRRGMPAELNNELFCSLPLENAFGLLAKMPNGLLARNVQKMIENCFDFGPLLANEGRFIIKHLGPNGLNCVQAAFPIPTFKLNVQNIVKMAYYEVKIIKKSSDWSDIVIGFCDQPFPLEGEMLGRMENSIGIMDQSGIWIDGARKADLFGGGFFKKGDFIGIGLIHLPYAKMECFVTLNGDLLDKYELPPQFGHLQLFPAANLFNAGDSIRFKFGKSKWQFKDFQKCF